MHIGMLFVYVIDNKQTKGAQHQMNVLFYATANDGVGERFRREVEASVPKKKREIHRTCDSLSRRLLQFPSDLPIAVLLASRIEDLLELLPVRSLLLDIRTILILPDREKNTVALGHFFDPLFLSYADSNFKKVAAVLKKMIVGIWFPKIIEEKATRN